MIWLTRGGEKTEIDVNFDGCDLLKNQNLDSSLIERSNCFVFEELEEYTFELTRYIMKIYPDSKIFYLDPKAKYFFENHEKVIILKSIQEIDCFWQNKYMYIYSNIKQHEHIIPEYVSLIYNSENVMSSLCWARERKCFGEKNSDKIILLIDMEFGKGCGLAYIVRTTCTLACMAQERGWIPVANLRGNNMYVDSPSDNMWEQYFLPLSNVSVEEALKSRNVISVKSNHLNPKVIYINPYFREIWNCPQRHLHLEFNNEIKDYFSTYMPKEIYEKNYKILGILMRGTDAGTAAKSKKEMKFIIEECREIVQDNGVEKVFLATEDADYFEAFKAAFNEKLLFIEQKRVVADEQDCKSVGELLNIPAGEKRDFGQKYLLIINCLAQCWGLTYNITSGGYYLVNMQREEPYEFSYYLNSKETELDNIIEYLAMVEKNDITAIYGTGTIGKRVMDTLGSRNKNKIVFCDKKAENMSYQFEQYWVMAPSEALKEYTKEKIQGFIIATINYKDEVYQSLIVNGVKPEHILCIENWNSIL